MMWANKCRVTIRWNQTISLTKKKVVLCQRTNLSSRTCELAPTNVSLLLIKNDIPFAFYRENDEIFLARANFWFDLLSTHRAHTAYTVAVRSTDQGRKTICQTLLRLASVCWFMWKRVNSFRHFKDIAGNGKQIVVHRLFVGSSELRRK